MDKETIFIFLGCILFSIIGILFGYEIVKKNNFNIQKESVSEQLSQISKDSIFKESSKDNENLEKINERTKIIYKSYYSDTDKKDYKESYAPYFMLGKSKEDLEKTLPLWEVEAFNEKEVILKRNILEHNNQNYILSIKDNFLAVFYGDNLGENSLKEITNIPVDHLAEEEKVRLEEGVLVIGDEELSRRLEDYGS